MIAEVEIKNGSDFCVVTAYDDNIRELGDLTSRIMIDYCRKQRYDFRVYTSGQDKTKHPSWSKILFVKETLKDYKWVLWIDADATFTNHSIRLEQFVRLNGVLTICKGICGLNAGVFILRNCKMAFDFLDRVWNEYNPENSTWEQETIVRISNTMGNHVVVHHPRNFNSKIGDPYPEDMRWRNGDFIVHVLGASVLTKEKILRMKKVLRECSEFRK